MAERTAAAGYIAIGKETTKGTAVTPSLFTPYYSQSMTTDLSLMSDEPAYGSKFKRIQHLPGVRSHTGSVQVMAEANTIASWFDMLMAKGSTTGAGPYTHPYNAVATEPKSYTTDISLGGHDTIRFFGVEASKIAIGWDDEKMVLDLDLSALKSFYTREIASIASQAITLKSNGQYDAPTNGLVVGDLLQIWDVSTSTYINCVVSAITSDTVVTVTGTISGATTGDILSLRPLTPSLSLLTPFLYSKTRFFFGDTAANAQTASATASNQTRLEPGTTMEFMHEFDDNAGAKRSGSFDPAALVRKQFDANFGVKAFLDTPTRHNEWAELTKRALVMRAYSGASNEYELRVTLNSIIHKTNETPTDAESVVFHEVEYGVDYKSADGQAFDVKVINNRSTI